MCWSIDPRRSRANGAEGGLTLGVAAVLALRQALAAELLAQVGELGTERRQLLFERVDPVDEGVG
jgi:hypothetical protein